MLYAPNHGPPQRAQIPQNLLPTEVRIAAHQAIPSAQTRRTQGQLHHTIVLVMQQEIRPTADPVQRGHQAVDRILDPVLLAGIVRIHDPVQRNEGHQHNAVTVLLPGHRAVIQARDLQVQEALVPAQVQAHRAQAAVQVQQEQADVNCWTTKTRLS
jgi:hypothetical protein